MIDVHVKQTTVTNLSEGKRKKLADEVSAWENRELSPGDFEPAPDASPRAKETEAISIRLPFRQLLLLKEFARRDGIGYQVLIKRWLDDRLKSELERLRNRSGQIRVRPREADLRIACAGAEVRLEAMGQVRVQRPEIERYAATCSDVGHLALKQC